MAVDAGHEAVGIDALTYAGRSKNLTERPSNLLAFYRYDINVASVVGGILREHQPDAIVHLAAETHVSRSIESREAFLQTNVMGTNVLLEEALTYWLDREAHFFKFVHVSTDEVYGSLSPEEAPWTEVSPYRPNNPYSASKAASDHLALSYHHTYGLPVIVTHSANNYGSRQHPEKFIPTMIRQCMNGEPMTLHGDGQQIRDWLHVDDHCRGLLAVLERGRIGEVYNFGGECERTNEQIARIVWTASWPALKDMWGQNLSWHSPETFNMLKFTADRPGNDRRYAMDISKVRAELGWSPTRKIEESIHDVVCWYLENPNYGEDYGR